MDKIEFYDILIGEEASMASSSIRCCLRYCYNVKLGCNFNSGQHLS